MDRIDFVDVTLRDGQQSLWAERMTTGMMLPIAGELDAAGFDALEIIAPSHIVKCVRDLREDPFERIRSLAARIKRTPLRLNVAGMNIFGHDQPAMYDLFLRTVAAAGITQTRISDSWNDPASWRLRALAVRRAGITPIINITYSLSPRHTDDYYAERTRAAAQLAPYRLCLKDPGGLLTPERTRTLVPVMIENANGVPIELHTHCSTGLGPLCCIEAVKQGVRIINTAIPPLADGPSLPSVVHLAAALRTFGYRAELNEQSLYRAREHLAAIARQEKWPVGVPAARDPAQYVHQVPGGMISNMRHQLREVGAEPRLAEALDESVQVRADFGYPIMVTPLSQFVGSQAAINVIVGERYKEVTDQTILYALGHFGGDVAALMNAEVRARILDRPRARALAAVERPDLSLDEMRASLDAAGASDEDLLLRFLMRKEDVDLMRAAGPAKAYATVENPLVALVANLAKFSGTNLIQISRPGFALALRRSAPSGQIQ